MKHWELEFFIIGFFLGYFIMGIFRLVADSDYNHVKQKLESIEQACEKVQSEPKSFDINEVTCTNGKTYKIQ